MSIMVLRYAGWKTRVTLGRLWPTYSLSGAGKGRHLSLAGVATHPAITYRHRSCMFTMSRLILISVIFVLAAVEHTNGYNLVWLLCTLRNATPRFLPSCHMKALVTVGQVNFGYSLGNKMLTRYAFCIYFKCT